MPGNNQTKVYVAIHSNVIKSVVSTLEVSNDFDLHFINPDEIGETKVICDIFVIDHMIFSESNYRIKKEIEASSPSALILCLVGSLEEAAKLSETVDWAVTYSDLQDSLNIVVKALQVIRRKAERGIFFDELLTLSRSIKHDASNALAVACGAAGRLGKVPGVSDSSFYQLLLDSHKQLIDHLDRLVEVHEKYRSAGLYKKKVDQAS